MKCEACKSSVQVTFLNKIIGTYIKDSKGKKHLVCQACQEKYSNDKEKILKAI